MNCVVSCNERVRAVGLVDPKLEQQQPPGLLQQLGRLLQHTDTWLQYLSANYYFANKDDIIDDDKYEHTLIQNECKNTNIYSDEDTILTRQQAQSHISSLSLIRAHEVESSHESPASYLDRVLLIADIDQICTGNRVDICGIDSNSGSDKNFDYQSINEKHQLEDKATPLAKQQYSLLVTLTYSLLLFVLIISKNAVPCSGFSSFMRPDNLGVIGYNYVSVSTS